MKDERSCPTDQKCRTLAEGKSVVIFKLKIFKINISRLRILNFCVKIKLSKKFYKNHFLNKNNLLLLVIIFAIIIKIKNLKKYCWKIISEQTIGSLKWPLGANRQRRDQAGPPLMWAH